MRLDKHTLLWTAGVVAVSAAFFLLVIRRDFQRVDRAMAELTSEAREHRHNVQERSASAVLQKQVNALVAQVANFETRVPQEEMLGSFVEDLARAAQKHQLRADAIEPAASVRSSQVSATPVTVKVRGSFPQVYALLRDLEHMPRLTQVERFKTQMLADKPGIVAAEIRLNVFYRSGSVG
jgi:Tfp pilus assembly protein PilO